MLEKTLSIPHQQIRGSIFMESTWILQKMKTTHSMDLFRIKVSALVCDIKIRTFSKKFDVHRSSSMHLCNLIDVHIHSCALSSTAYMVCTIVFRRKLFKSEMRVKKPDSWNVMSRKVVEATATETKTKKNPLYTTYILYMYEDSDRLYVIV